MSYFDVEHTTVMPSYATSVKTDFLFSAGAPRFGPRTMYGDEFTGPQLRMLRSLAASPAAVVTSREAAVEEEPGSDQEEQDDLAMENDDNGGVGGGSKREFYGVRRNKMPQGFRFSANPWLIKQQFRKPPQMSPNFKKKKLKLIY